MELQEEAKTYILQFLTGFEDESIFRKFRIGYTSDRALFEKYDLVFIPSGFFQARNYGQASSLPWGELPQIQGVPFLFGTDFVEKAGSTVVVHADLVATVFFFISRYEEICRRDVRDIHGRFPGEESLLFKNQLIFRPVLDEYPALVRAWLREAGVDLPEPRPKLAKLWLTHDVDAPFYCKGLRSFIRESLRGKGPMEAFKWLFGKDSDDPYYTFPFFLEQDGLCKANAEFPVQSVYFFKAIGKGAARLDKPLYNLKSKRIKRLVQLLQSPQAIFGLHGSYFSGGGKADPMEKRRLEWACGRRVFFFRNHYLRSCEPEHFLSLENMGITDDFTMGYADVAGFRLATSRPVIWIDPNNGRLSRLVLHPLIIMDSTLAESKYMGLDFETAKNYCTLLINAARQRGGEVCLLWHNSSITEGEYPSNKAPWLRQLYAYLLEYLVNIS